MNISDVAREAASNTKWQSFISAQEWIDLYRHIERLKELGELRRKSQHK